MHRFPFESNAYGIGRCCCTGKGIVLQFALHIVFALTGPEFSWGLLESRGIAVVAH